MDTSDEQILAAIRAGNNTARRILEFLNAHGIKMSQPTLSRRVSALASQNHVHVIGSGRNTRYLIDDLADFFATPERNRPSTGYNTSFIAEYQPNQTEWLSTDIKNRLTEAGGGRHIDASSYSKAIAQKLLVDLSYASSQLEGNTYSYLDTQVLIEYGQVAEGKAAEETQMILNHKEAIVYLIDNIDDIGIDLREIRTMHALLSRGLIQPEDVGTVRHRIVHIGGSAYVPMAIPHRLEEEMNRIVAKATAINDPFEQSLFLMTMISYLQYFTDVNKRTGRLMANVPLLKAGLSPLSFLGVDKAKYVKGLLAFYELGRHDIIADAYAEGYLESASRYDAYTGRDRAEVEIEYKRRSDLYDAVRSYVAQSLSQGARPDAIQHLEQIFDDEPSDTRDLLIRRASAIIESLNDGNNVAYGISRKDFDEFERLGAQPGPSKP